MSDTFPPSAEMAANAHVDAAKYDAMYAASIADPDAFWGEHGTADRLDDTLHQVKTFDFTLAMSTSNGSPTER